LSFFVLAVPEFLSDVSVNPHPRGVWPLEVHVRPLLFSSKTCFAKNADGTSIKKRTHAADFSEIKHNAVAFMHAEAASPLARIFSRFPASLLCCRANDDEGGYEGRIEALVRAQGRSCGLKDVTHCLHPNKKPPGSGRVAAFEDSFAVANT
jgi:hypothetical protein